MIWQFIINGLITGLLYSLLAIGFALVYNTTHIFHIAAAGIYVFAAYMFWWLSGKLGLPIIVAAALAIILTMGLSLLSEVGVYRPLRKKHSSLNAVMIASIGLMTVIVNFLAMVFGTESKAVMRSIRTYQFGDLILTTPQLYQTMAAVMAITVFLVLLDGTRLGLKVRALSSDETLFETLGYDKQRTVSIVFLLSGLFIGLASCVTVFDLSLHPNMGMTVLINAMVAMIIGGNGKFWTCVAGGLVLGVVQSLTVFQFSSNWQDAIAFALLLVFLFLRPQGIAGLRQRAV
jgi:branched-chain amino acid transport system permease protein